jgi:hypothetical protein
LVSIVSADARSETVASAKVGAVNESGAPRVQLGNESGLTFLPNGGGCAGNKVRAFLVDGLINTVGNGEVSGIGRSRHVSIAGGVDLDGRNLVSIAAAAEEGAIDELGAGGVELGNEAGWCVDGSFLVGCLERAGGNREPCAGGAADIRVVGRVQSKREARAFAGAADIGGIDEACLRRV